MTDRVGATERYEYDALGRIRTWSGASFAAKYRFDDAGNLRHRSGDAEAPTTLEFGVDVARGTIVDSSTDGVSYVHDEAGRLVQTVQADSGAELRRIEYTSFDLPKAISDRGQLASSYVYGPHQQRVFKEEPAGTVTYVGDLLDIRRSNGSEERVYHILGPEGRIADLVVSGSDRKRLYSFSDRLGSTSVVTDNAGSVVSRTRFDLFGSRVEDLNPTKLAAANPLASVSAGFTGHEQEDSLGLVNMRGRVYEPRLGRFLSTDPLAQTEDGSLNRHTYAHGAVLSRTDPSGYDDCSGEHKEIYISAGVCGKVVAPKADAGDKTSSSPPVKPPATANKSHASATPVPKPVAVPPPAPLPQLPAPPRSADDNASGGHTEDWHSYSIMGVSWNDVDYALTTEGETIAMVFGAVSVAPLAIYSGAILGAELAGGAVTALEAADAAFADWVWTRAIAYGPFATAGVSLGSSMIQALNESSYVGGGGSGGVGRAVEETVQHHVFPQQFEPEFEWIFRGSGESIHDYTVRIGRSLHDKVHGSGWNPEWEEFLHDVQRGRLPNLAETKQFAAEMMHDYGLSGFQFEKYRNR